MKRPWRWMRIADLCTALRWPFDHCARGKYGAQNDNGWIVWNGSSVHHTDLAATKAYWLEQAARDPAWTPLPESASRA